ncbi:MAG: BhlA/UviB family holin-like peptide [Vallitalea sp.]|jgi:beta-lactamase regulating signal transducer with metallopeptidase domain|nr:BhlA/UviB family holin-like peptide [Vallitalea sp.]
MEETILNIAATQGIWAVVAVVLIFYILKTQEKRDVRQEERERNFQMIIIDLTKHLDTIEELKEDVSIIKKNMLIN